MRFTLSALFFYLLVAVGLPGFAQGIQGTIKNTKGEALPNASIFISELNTGLSSNESGRFSVKLPPGKFTFNVSYLGYRSQQFQFQVKDEWLDRDIVLSIQELQLQEVVVGKGNKEDFAYTIIRKAIARKKFHMLQYNSYEMTAYIKGTGELKKAPFFVRNRLKKEGFKLDEAYTLESVSKFKFTQPAKVEEKVISIRTKGENNSTVSPSMFLNTSFYQDKIGPCISPLSRSAFAHYKFSYEGSFTEKDDIIYKIRVKPRSKGDNVFDGYIYLVDERWAIHSVDLATSVMGFPIKVRQNYAELMTNVWMPVTHQYRFSGNVLGFAGEFNYLVSCRNYKINLNKELLATARIVDEKVDELPQELLKKTATDGREAAELLRTEKPMTRRQYVKLLDKYEKESLKTAKDPAVVSERSFSIDSLAGKRDSSYWDSIRPVPLTVKEQEGYRRDDSLVQVQQEIKSDSTRRANRGFSPVGILTGGNYRLSKSTSISLNSTLLNTNFNTVEGLNLNAGGRLTHKLDTAGRRRIEFAPVLRYGFTSDKFYARARLSYKTSEEDKASLAFIEGGSFVEQFNPRKPIGEFINTVTTLVGRRNHMKLFEKQYVKALYSFKPSGAIELEASAEWAGRTQLRNTSDYSLFYRDSRSFTANSPHTHELASTSFPRHQAVVLQANVELNPFQRYRIIDGRKIPLDNGVPKFSFQYTKGLNAVLGSDIDYDKLQLSIRQTLPIGAGNRLELELTGGTFLNNKRTFFMDYQHFDGNRTLLTSLERADAFRLLHYYLYSTDNSYVSVNAHYRFRKLLFTRIPELRYTGLKENIFANYLKTSSSPHYYELGYSLDNIFRVLRLEVATSFQDGKYKELGFRVGITSLIRFNRN